jgi:hypothetical protein
MPQDSSEAPLQPLAKDASQGLPGALWAQDEGLRDLYPGELRFDAGRYAVIATGAPDQTLVFDLASMELHYLPFAIKKKCSEKDIDKLLVLL